MLRTALLFSSLLAGGLERDALAQTSGGTPAQAHEPYVLHVYQDLVQVPTLVLTSTHESLEDLPATRFEVQLDQGPKFHPKAVRREGDDPVSLSLLLDARHGEHEDLVRSLLAGVGRLPADLLGSADRLSVFAYDCTLVNSVVNEPASAKIWQAGVRAALQAPGLHGAAGKRSRCGQTVHLWDAVAAVTSQAANLPGRRVLVVISDGNDTGSRISAEADRGAATALGLTVFGIRPMPPQRPVSAVGILSKLFLETAMNDTFGVLCGGTGGLLAGSDPGDVDQTVERIMGLVRSRYILEFSRPQNSKVGAHQIDVTVQNPSAIVRVSGVTVAVQDEAQRNDPHTVRGGSSKGPVMGKQPH